MLPEKKTTTNIGVLFGILFHGSAMALNRILQEQAPKYAPLVVAPLFLIGTAFFIWGCVNYCQGKGQPAFLGLLGLLSCFGLIILVFLPDRYPDGRRRRGGRYDDVDDDDRLRRRGRDDDDDDDDRPRRRRRDDDDDDDDDEPRRRR